MEYLLITFLIVGATNTVTQDDVYNEDSFNVVHIGMDRIDEQIDLLERIIAIRPAYDAKKLETLKARGVKISEEMEKRLQLMQKCFRRIKDHAKKGLIKHNALMRRIMDWYLPHDRRTVPESLGDLQKEYLYNLMEDKFFYFQAMPAYVKKVCKDLNLTIGESEMQEAEAVLRPMQIKGTEEILNASRVLGVGTDELPFNIH